MREDEIKKLLLNLNASQDSIEASALVSSDGLIIASALAPGLDEDHLGALATAVLSLGDNTAAALACGAMEQVMISGADRHLLILQAGPEAVLCAIARPGVKLGPLLLDASYAASVILPNAGNQGSILNDPSLETLRFDGGLGPEDETIMATIQTIVIDLLPALTTLFYDVISTEPRALQALTSPIANAQAIHLAWLQQVFNGNYGPGFMQRQRDMLEFKNLKSLPTVFVATSIAFLRAAMAPMVVAKAPGQPEAPAITATILRLLDLCQYLTDPKYAELFSPFEQVKKQNAWQQLARRTKESTPL
ncbi:MAG: roadblock/LC7 domain-containing protein [Acidocella sp.]|nr:roadblock/LC7 domain-containing protein [Acidocella sp.]